MKRLPEEERLQVMTKLERPLWETPGVLLAGMDEVGRGPLAGPVVTACVALPPAPLIRYVNDSKKLSPARREKLYDEILAAAAGHAIGWVDEREIDSINILEATKKAFCQAYAGMPVPPTDVLIDAVKGLDIPARQHSYIHGDAISYLIAAASIVAKVTRDRYMIEQDALYPAYGFAQNKGYGTAAHIAALKQYGPCPLHRNSFITNILEGQR